MRCITGQRPSDSTSRAGCRGSVGCLAHYHHGRRGAPRDPPTTRALRSRYSAERDRAGRAFDARTRAQVGRHEQLTNSIRAPAAMIPAAGGLGVTYVKTQSTLGISSTEGNFTPLGGATEWLDSAPMSPDELRSKVVLVKLWTTRVSIGCASFRMSVPGLKNTTIWSLSAYAPRSSRLSITRTTCGAQQGHAHRLPDRNRQPVCRVGRMCEPLLAGAVLHRCKWVAFGITSSARVPTRSPNVYFKDC